MLRFCKVLLFYVNLDAIRPRYVVLCSLGDWICPWYPGARGETLIFYAIVSSLMAPCLSNSIQISEVQGGIHTCQLAA